MDKSKVGFNPITNTYNNNLRQSQQNNINKTKNNENNFASHNNYKYQNINPNPNIYKNQINNKKSISPNVICNYHNLEIGGCCENFECARKQQIFCIKCASDPNFCIREEKHEFIAIEEFITNFTDRELINLKNDNSYSKAYIDSVKFLDDQVNIKNDFLEKSRIIQDEINDYYLNLIDHIKKSLDDFNERFEKFVNSKFNSLLTSFDNLNNILSFELLCKFDKNKLVNKSHFLDSAELNNFILTMKQTINNYKKKNCELDLENIKIMIDMKLKNENVFMIKKKFEEIKIEIDQKHLSFLNNLDKNIFLSDKISLRNNISCNRIINSGVTHFNSIYSDNQNNKYFEENSLNRLSLFKEFTIDFNINSSFIDKTFLIFDHSNGNSYLAFPTSNYAIKLVYFNRILQDIDFSVSQEDGGEVQKNENKPFTKFGYHKGQLLTQKDFERPEPVDKFLFYKLLSHGGKVTHIKYYRLCLNTKDDKDLLLSASEDKCLKIWDISNLNKSFDDLNLQYKNNCLRTILAHDNNRIANFVNFYDPLKNKNFIVSSGFGDKIKVWDMNTGNIYRDISDTNKGPNFDTNMLVFHEQYSSKNFMVTSGHNSSIRIFDFDSGKILKSFQHKEKIVDLIYFTDNTKNFRRDDNKDNLFSSNNNLMYENLYLFSLPKIFIVDETGICASVHFEKNEKSEVIFNFTKEKVNCGSSLKSGGVKWNDKKMFFYCKNGQLYEYEIDDFIENVNKLNVSDNYNNLSNKEKNVKINNMIQIGNSPISYCMKYRDIKYGDLIILHSHDQLIKIFKIK